TCGLRPRAGSLTTSQTYSFSSTPFLVRIMPQFMLTVNNTGNLSCHTLQNEESDLRWAIDSQGQSCHSHAAVCILEHIPDLVKSTWIFSSQIGQNGGT